MHGNPVLASAHSTVYLYLGISTQVRRVTRYTHAITTPFCFLGICSTYNTQKTQMIRFTRQNLTIRFCLHHWGVLQKVCSELNAQHGAAIIVPLRKRRRYALYGPNYFTTDFPLFTW